MATASGGRKVVAENRKARRNYEIAETIEAGIALAGTEVKSLRTGKANIADSYASDDAGELSGMALVTDIKFQLAAFAGTNVQGVDNDFAGLSSLGITLVDNNAVADDLDHITGGDEPVGTGTGNVRAVHVEDPVPRFERDAR